MTGCSTRCIGELGRCSSRLITRGGGCRFERPPSADAPLPLVTAPQRARRLGPMQERSCFRPTTPARGRATSRASQSPRGRPTSIRGPPPSGNSERPSIRSLARLGGPLDSLRRMAKGDVVVDHLWKTFRIYHQRNSTLKQAVTRRRSDVFDEFWALKDVSFEVRAGSTLGLIG